MNKKVVSIITTFYNAETYIDQALLSVVNQEINDTFEIEYILINDCSTDNSLKIATEIKNNYESRKGLTIKIFTPESNLGCGGARKFGISKATGNYFMFLDADDYYINFDFVKRAIKDIEENDADIVEYGVLFNTNNGQSQNMVVQSKKEYCNGSLGVFMIFHNNTIKFNVWSKIYTRAIIDSYPYDDNREYEDIRTIPMWVYNAKKIVVMPTVEINYRAAANSIIREDGIKSRIGTITAMTEMCEHFKNDKNIVKALYKRAMIDLSAVLLNNSSKDESFNIMSRLNTKLLSYIYPDTYKDITYNIEDDHIEDDHIEDEENNLEVKNIT